MTFDTMLAASKIVSLLIFLPFFVGVVGWAYSRKNKERFDAYARLPLEED